MKVFRADPSSDQQKRFCVTLISRLHFDGPGHRCLKEQPGSQLCDWVDFHQQQAKLSHCGFGLKNVPPSSSWLSDWEFCTTNTTTLTVQLFTNTPNESMVHKSLAANQICLPVLSDQALTPRLRRLLAVSEPEYQTQYLKSLELPLKIPGSH